ncbi:LptF/LptG family permease [Candidatus Deferrimicrobium sp.]|uniref:LptF/LptG family permease n=1 Tax=Candidatus Deferrimicrobium sp. TaxID=3060586 RepID=UPI003C4B7FB4
MRITRRYLLGEITGPFLVGVGSFTVIVLLQRFSRLADMVIAKGVPTPLVGRLLLSLLPPFFEITLPASLLLAVLLGLGRLASDSETTALSAAGVGMRGVAVPVLAASIITCAAVLLTGWQGVPWGYRETQRTLARIVSERAGAGASEHVFREITPEVMLYPDRVTPDGQRMSGIFLSFRPAGDDPLLVFAREGRFLPAAGDGVVALELSDGTIHGEPAEKPLYRIASFGRMTFRIPLDPSSIPGGDDPKGMTLPELSRKVDATGGGGANVTYRYHFHRRISLAVSCLSFGLLAIPLGFSLESRGKSSAVGITVALILVYYLFIAAAGAVEKRSGPGMIAFLWAPNALGLSLAAWILWRSERSVTILPRPFGRGRLRK